jgi:DNA-binding MarR family transcriptional regulator
VEKTISDEDQRVKVVRLTQQSLDFKDAFIELTDNVNARVFKGFTKAEREQFVQLLSKAVNNY